MLVLSASHLPSISSVKVKQALAPVVLVPGNGGNQLDISLTEAYKSSHFLCKRSASSCHHSFRLWLNLWGILPPFTKCFAERIKLAYNPDTGLCQNAPGVESVVPYFGSTQGMASLDPNFQKLSVYMGVIVDTLEAHGYVDGKSLLGAPYDFRYAPGMQASLVATTYLENLKSLIEKAYYNNDNQKVILFSHSLGGLWGLHFLNQQPLVWRQKYVKRFIAVSAPWGGTVQMMRTFASGYAEGIPFIDPLVLREEQRSAESNFWLLPVYHTFGNTSLVITPNKSYTALDIPEFFEDIGYSEGVPLYLSRVPPLVHELEAPGVPVTLIFSCGIATPETLVYGKQGFDRQPEMINGDGDGTINLCSLRAVVERWKAIEELDLKVIEIYGKNHTNILTDAMSAALIFNEIMKESVLEGALVACFDVSRPYSGFIGYCKLSRRFGFAIGSMCNVIL